MEQTKEIVNDTKQTANDEKIDTEENISMMTYFKKFLQNDEGSDMKSSFIQDETSTDSGNISAMHSISLNSGPCVEFLRDRRKSLEQNW